MSLHLPSRRVFGTAPTTLRRLRSSVTILPILTHPRCQEQQRTYKNYSDIRDTTKKSASASSSASGSKKDLINTPFGDMSSAETRRSIRERMRSGRMEGDSIFAEELAQQPDVDSSRTPTQRPSNRDPGSTNEIGASIIKEHMARAVDPDPRSRVRWERKVVMRHVARALSPSGHETRSERIRRTEREHLAKSARLGTSTKKLVHLARQIRGKTLADAIVQMRFSKKRAAKDVKFTLEEAATEAIVRRGMGLGKANGEVHAAGEGVKIQTKDGKWMAIEDPTRMYVAEAWVGRGSYRGYRIEYKGRGHMGLWKRPTATISIVLKEEKTRIREHNERKVKEDRRGPWVHLPNRPVTAQRPFYSW